MIVARGNFRNWEGRGGDVSGTGKKYPKHFVECLWCGWRWNSMVPHDPVCPKCNLTNGTAKEIIDSPGGHPVYGWKWNLRRKTWAKRNYYRNHPEELRL